MKHAEVVIARRAVEEGRGLVVIVNKMDLLRGKNKSSSYEQIMEAVQQEIQTIIPQVWYVVMSLALSRCSLNWTIIHDV
jgi:predicted GTPase